MSGPNLFVSLVTRHVVLTDVLKKNRKLAECSLQFLIKSMQYYQILSVKGVFFLNI